VRRADSRRKTSTATPDSWAAIAARD